MAQMPSKDANVKENNEDPHQTALNCLLRPVCRSLGYFVLKNILTCMIYEPRCEKTGLRGFRPGPTQTGLYSHGRSLVA